MKFTSPARPQADGQTERINRSFKEILSKGTRNRLKWDIEINNIEFAVNSSVNTSTKLSPMSIVLGFEPRMPININTQYNIHFTDAHFHYRQIAQDNIVEVNYEPGDWVLVRRSKLLSIKSFKLEDQLKLLPNYCGPFRIVLKHSKLNYKVKISNSRKGERVVHVDDIKPFIEEDRTLFADRMNRSHIPLGDEIEAIIDSRNRRYGRGSRCEYKIRYKNGSEDHDEWVPAHCLDDVSNLIREYEDKVNAGTDNLDMSNN